ncbi:CEREBLON [Salix purpurea]|uniref:CEREBLON n=1 Tax=Salix purpurea TaxID=77065 RepID=A0A9Q0YVN8_SALPP|nr:CEREBLON [Salix purpurea]
MLAAGGISVSEMCHLKGNSFTIVKSFKETLSSVSILVFAEPSLTQEGSTTGEAESHRAMRILSLVREKGRVGYTHVWPEMRFGWKIVLGSIIGFFGAACGSVGGVGGGGIFVPMLSLIIGFDTKSATAMSKCMITGGAAATVYYNLKLRHPTLELPIIDYDLALLFQPMLVLGISIGVALNVIFANWMITILLIVLFIVTSTKAFFKGVETWKKETKTKKEATKSLESNDDRNEEVVGEPPPCGPTGGAQTETKEYKKEQVSIIENVYWKELALLVAVWVIILALQIGKNYSTTCSMAYWLLNILQIPVAFGVSSYEAFCLYKGRRKIASKGRCGHNLEGLLAGIVGGMLGLGGGFILGPLFLEMGIPPQVSSATATFAMMFSASMSVVEYYLLKRFPVPYALYYFAVATVAALVGQHVVRKLISILGRASLIIFTLAFTIFLSALLLGGVGIARMVKRIERKEYMGFENICS